MFLSYLRPHKILSFFYSLPTLGADMDQMGSRHDVRLGYGTGLSDHLLPGEFSSKIGTDVPILMDIFENSPLLVILSPQGYLLCWDTDQNLPILERNLQFQPTETKYSWNGKKLAIWNKSNSVVVHLEAEKTWLSVHYRGELNQHRIEDITFKPHSENMLVCFSGLDEDTTHTINLYSSHYSGYSDQIELPNFKPVASAYSSAGDLYLLSSNGSIYVKSSDGLSPIRLVYSAPPSLFRSFYSAPNSLFSNETQSPILHCTKTSLLFSLDQRTILEIPLDELKPKTLAKIPCEKFDKYYFNKNLTIRLSSEEQIRDISMLDLTTHLSVRESISSSDEARDRTPEEEILKFTVDSESKQYNLTSKLEIVENNDDEGQFVLTVSDNTSGELVDEFKLPPYSIDLSKSSIPIPHYISNDGSLSILQILTLPPKSKPQHELALYTQEGIINLEEANDSNLEDLPIVIGGTSASVFLSTNLLGKKNQVFRVGKKERKLEPLSLPPFANHSYLSIHQNGKLLVISENKLTTIYRVDGDDAERIGSFTHDETRPDIFAVSHDGHLIAAGFKASIVVYDAVTGLPVSPRYKIADSSLMGLAFHPSKPALLALSRDYLEFFHFSQKKLSKKEENYITSLTKKNLSPHNQNLFPDNEYRSGPAHQLTPSSLFTREQYSHYLLQIAGDTLTKDHIGRAVELLEEALKKDPSISGGSMEAQRILDLIRSEDEVAELPLKERGLTFAESSRSAPKHFEIEADNILKLENGLEMIWCPPGGGTTGRWPFDLLNEAGQPALSSETGAKSPLRYLLTDGYFLAKTETTQALWYAVTGSSLRDHAQAVFEDQSTHKFGNKTATYAEYSISKKPQSVEELILLEAPTGPMVWISAREIEEFCNQLNLLALKNRWIPRGWSFRLPTDLEWSRACVADGSNPVFKGEYSKTDNCKAPAISPFAWYAGNSSLGFLGPPTFEGVKRPGREFEGGNLGPHLVDTRKLNPWGFADIFGNVGEFCIITEKKLPLATNKFPLDSKIQWRTAGGGFLNSFTLPVAGGNLDSSYKSIASGFRLALVFEKSSSEILLEEIAAKAIAPGTEEAED